MNLMFLYFNLLYVLYIKKTGGFGSLNFLNVAHTKPWVEGLCFLKFLNKLYVNIIADYLLKTGINCR